MGVPVLILGASGSGKSASLRNFAETEVGIFSVASKPLPFRKKLPIVNHASYNTIFAGLNKNSLRCYVIDDSQYLMCFESMAKAKDVGYTKFTDIAVNFYKLIDTIINHTSDDTIVYLLHHEERTDMGMRKAKTIGKMLDNQLTLEGLFSIVLFAETDGRYHWFITQSDGYTTAKSPMEMFPERIPNDLKEVDTAIREYYGLNGGNVNEEN